MAKHIVKICNKLKHVIFTHMIFNKFCTKIIDENRYLKLIATPGNDLLLRLSRNILFHKKNARIRIIKLSEENAVSAKLSIACFHAESLCMYHGTSYNF